MNEGYALVEACTDIVDMDFKTFTISNVLTIYVYILEVRKPS